MATINHKVKILNENKTAYDTYHAETNVGQVYDFSKSKWLNEIISDIELELSNVTGGINVSELDERLNLTIEDLESAESMISAIEAELAKKYVKPENGIAIGDLSQAIKDSLAKADRIPTIEAELAKVRTDLKSYIDSKIEEIKLKLKATVEEHVATQGQTSIVLENTYNLNTDILNVEVGGIEQFTPDNYTKNTDENGVTTITFAEALPEGVVVTIVYYGNIEAFDTIVASHVDNNAIHITEEERNRWNSSQTKIATRSEVGSVKIGNGLNVNLSGELSVAGQVAKLTLDSGAVLPANGNDLNEMLAGGFYYGYSLKNAPSTAGYVVVLKRNDTYVSQLFFDNNGVSSNDMFRRNLINGEWQTWVKVLDSDDILDDLTSTNISSALSANKGRELKALIDEKADKTVASTTSNGLMSMVDKIKLDGLSNTPEYVHPSTHPASMILEDAQKRFVSDTEKSTWNNKADKTIATSSANGLLSSADKSKLDGIATGANKVNVVNVLTSTSTTDALSASAGKTLKDLIDTKTVEVSPVTSTSNGLMISTDKVKLDGIASGATNTTIVNNLQSTSTSSALSAYQGKVLADGFVDHFLDISNPHSVTTEQVNFLNSAKLPTDYISTYSKGFSVFGLSGTGVDAWIASTGITKITSISMYGFVETTFAPNESNNRGYQRVVFLDTNGNTLGIFGRSAYGTSTWGAWSKTLLTKNKWDSTLSLGTGTASEGADSLAFNGTASGGSGSFAIGSASTQASSVDSLAIGRGAKASGADSTAIGYNATASAGISLAMVYGATASQQYAIAIGHGAIASNIGQGVLGNSNYTNNWIINGSLSVSSGLKNFEIPHPHPDKRYTHTLRHGAVESPTAGDTLYRYTIEAKNDGETVEIQLPDYFEYLNKDVDVWVNPHKHFGRSYGEVVGDKLLVTCEVAGVYKALVIGTRNDDCEAVQLWDIKGVERENGESWMGETYVFEYDEISEVTELEDY